MASSKTATFVVEKNLELRLKKVFKLLWYTEVSLVEEHGPIAHVLNINSRSTQAL